MEKHQVIFPLIVFFGFISFSLCIAAEFKKSKKKDLRLDGKYCYFLGSAAFGLGIAALTCLFIAQFIGNLLICRKLFSRDKTENSSKVENKSIIAGLFLALSWISFGIAVILIGASTSMSRNQHFGEGWLDGECYIVKDGVYTGSAVLVLVTLSSTLGSAIMRIRKRNQVEQDRKVLQQVLQ
ncbi:protein MODIFYING WALL LIGNIN-1-like [Nicotiana sylvestris]|uniref:Uncharacterized protein LOC104246408 n=1 Tax=Nicotiana sylvestris TaxID=4096 RepID=A0A1U7YMQ8_NICSY|nr:PREDICTED: uncharacterized protein LOC104246408 [Nicotiana sylvestris]